MKELLRIRVVALLESIGEDVPHLREEDLRDLEARLSDLTNRLRTPAALWSPRFERVEAED